LVPAFARRLCRRDSVGRLPRGPSRAKPGWSEAPR